MAKKFGKIILLGAVVGVAAAGVYHYLQNKEKAVDEFDDFDDLDNFDDVVNESETETSRTYVALDTAKVLANDALDFAKDVYGKAVKKVQDTIEEVKAKAENEAAKELDEAEDINEVEDIEVTDAEKNADSEENETAKPKKSSKKNSKADEAEEVVAEVSDEDTESDSTEEFFDDDEA